MGYSQVALEEKLLQMYPEIERHGIKMGLRFDEAKDAWMVKFTKGHHVLETHLDRKDADECMDGIKCVYLGVKIGELVKNFEEG